MKSKVLANQKIIRRYQHRSWFLMVILFFILVGIVLYVTKEKVISPCPNDCSGAMVKVVYASEEKTELEQMVSYITQVFQPEGKQVVYQALQIAQCESKWNPKAYNFNTNGSSDYGLFQINSVHEKRYGQGFMYSWKANVDTAFALYKFQGWRPWVCKYVL